MSKSAQSHNTNTPARGYASLFDRMEDGRAGTSERGGIDEWDGVGDASGKARVDNDIVAEGTRSRHGYRLPVVAV